ncbi:Myxococcus cysteine-rich repeat-containing protein [Myxococcus fulvus]|uniref:Myxococcus cysteine-rich repeat-containing protein n=2 Tax=Myxococcus fulvus TaxID=33 RepID=A0A511SUP8_MYXFU|nr:amidohydrolase family protein [Myxococcus fulvus]GEN05639.1 hypothetical protein MFU01_06760 [Myxococcus fulvus]SET00433.1 Myxococcus cysteine-rich repeat-containing protein [Myxococcus fulvus]
MRMSPRSLLAALSAVLLFQVGCSREDPKPCEGTDCTQAAVCGNGVQEEGEACDDGNKVGGDGCEADCTSTPTRPQAACGNGRLEGAEVCDDGNLTGQDGCEADCSLTLTRCAAADAPPLASGATCEVSKPGNGARLFTGLVLKDDETLVGGQVLVDASGVITCASCDCSAEAGAAEATHVACPTGVISPGLINTHEHVTKQNGPFAMTDERYEHRLDWVVGLGNHTRIANSTRSAVDAVSYIELRHLLAGTTSIAGLGGAAGLLRNVDQPVSRLEGLDQWSTASVDFPLGNRETDIKTNTCDYVSMPRTSGLPNHGTYLPHLAEGIGEEALNEFRCLSTGINDVIQPRTSLISAVGVTAKEIALMAERGTGLIWSPRSNVALYGDTAMVTAYKRLGVNIALGTDWVQSGSMNLLRELKCADTLNTVQFDRAFSDVDLWRMVTSQAAEAVEMQAGVGRIAPGKLGDLAIYSLRTHAASPHRAVISAEAADVVLTMRGGKALYGDQALVGALVSGAEPCDALDVCGSGKTVCVQSELKKTLATLEAANPEAYKLFACGVPEGEPVCVPRRISNNPSFPASVKRSNVYSGESRSDDPDGDGLKGNTDNCPFVFNPIRPMDGGKQADSDGDGVGDACDVCPLNANTTTCTTYTAGDDDHDGHPTWQDNCPYVANPDQADQDGDGNGDACDACVSDPNPGHLGCSAVSVHQLKTQDGDGRYPWVGKTVSFNDVVVTALVRGALTEMGFWVQVHPLPSGLGVENSGIYVYAPKDDLVVGDRLDIVTATLTIYQGLPELVDVKYRKRGAGSALPTPVAVTTADVRTGGPRAKALEGVLVDVFDVTVSSGVDSFSQFLVNESGDPGQAGLMVDDFAYSYRDPAVGTKYGALRGVLTYMFSDSKVLPRSSADLMAPMPTLTSFGPGAYVRLGGTGAVSTFPQVLTLTLSGTYTEAIDVAVTSSNSAALRVVNDVVRVPRNQSSVEVKVEALAPAESVVLTATLRGVSRQATVRVLGQDEQALVARLSPAEVTMVPGGSVTYTVSLDRPAADNASVALFAAPETGFGTFTPAVSVPVAKNAMQTTFTFTLDEAAAGPSGTVTAVVGTSQASSTVTVDLTAPRLVSLSPAGPVSVRYGETLEFRVTLSSAPAQDLAVTLGAAPGTGVTRYGSVPATVTVPAGSTEATFLFTADAEGEGTGTVTASLLGVSRAATVTVTPPPAKLASLTPATATVYFGAKQGFTVTLDRAAQAGGAVVEVALTPATGLGTLESATVTVAEGQRTAQAIFTAGTEVATGTLSATYAGVTLTAQVSTAERPELNHLVVNEVDYDQRSTDTREFVELFNPTPVAVSLDGLFLVYVNGGVAQPVSYAKIDLKSVGTLGPGEYLVVGPEAVIGALRDLPGVKVLLSTTSIQNGGTASSPSADAVALYDSLQDSIVDSMSYEGPVMQASISGSQKRFDLQEGPRSTVGLVDIDTVEGSLSRIPNGSDTDDNVEDFRFTTQLTPGAPNVLVAP